MRLTKRFLWGWHSGTWLYPTTTLKILHLSSNTITVTICGNCVRTKSLSQVLCVNFEYSCWISMCPCHWRMQTELNYDHCLAWGIPSASRPAFTPPHHKGAALLRARAPTLNGFFPPLHFLCSMSFSKVSRSLQHWAQLLFFCLIPKNEAVTLFSP